MTAFRRFAIYYVPEPDDPLASFAAGWLGWDLNAAVACPRPVIPDLPRPLPDLTVAPSKYGYHGTLKPPFRSTGTLAEVTERAAEVAAGTTRFQMPALTLRRLGNFVALLPDQTSTSLTEMAFSFVRDLDEFRAPPTDQELAKRRAAGLTDRQEALLARWGYPYVGAEFRFHLTMTGTLTTAEAEAVETALAPRLKPFLAPRTVDSVALCGEINGGSADGRFAVIERLKLAE